MTLATIDVPCAEPGCTRTWPGVADFNWRCSDHAIPCWPDSDVPCSDWHDCGTTCYWDGWGFARDGQRGGNGYAVEDVQFTCTCEHHDGPSAGARWAEALRGAAAMRSHYFAGRSYRTVPLTLGVHPFEVQAIGQTPVLPGDRRYVAAWPEEREHGCPAWGAV